MKPAILFCLAVPAALSLVAGQPEPSADARLEAAAKATYTFRNFLKGDAITVLAADGVVTLKGTVEDRYHSALAEATVAALPGVRGVRNDLEVPAGEPVEPSDAWLITKVRCALLFRRDVNPAVRVEAQGGAVTLKGEVATLAQLEHTAQCVQDVEGVIKVDNQLAIARTAPLDTAPMGELLDDASVTAEVKSALLFHRSTHTLAAKIRTHAGQVTVDGLARNQAEKELVTRLVHGLRGVAEVRNRMQVAP